MMPALDVSVPVDDIVVVAPSPIHSILPPIVAVEVSRALVEDEDKELLDRLAADDQVAFRQLVERHIDRAYSIALRIVESSADAEDVVQDTFLKVWTHRGRWEHGRAKFSTWIYRVVANRCFDLKRRPRTEDVASVPEACDGQPDALSSLERSEASALLESALQQLPEQQRIAIILSYHENMSNSEIADVMETTVSAVESLLKRGRQHLRQTLRKHEGEVSKMFSDT